MMGLDWFPFHYMNYLIGTRGFTLSQKGAYIDLLCEQFEKGVVSVNFCSRVLTQLLTEEEKNGVLEKFSKVQNGFVNIRMNQEREKSLKIHRLRVKAARKAGLTSGQRRANAASTSRSRSVEQTSTHYNTIHNKTKKKDKEKENPLTGVKEKAGGSAGTVRPRGIQWPENFIFTEERKAYAEKKGVINPEEAWEAFESWAKKKGAAFKDWDHAWKNWCISQYQQRSGIL